MAGSRAHRPFRRFRSADAAVSALWSGAIASIALRVSPWMNPEVNFPPALT